ncbi:NAD(P)H-dependent flavin oxidoreductase [Luteococcus peritonei]|uniref:Propionate 3-nitronate monooxygenase n=1 Tax=Luteococcus peritonei TaxID=88874 RepID=A0ABW4RTF9_9ACTN
MDLPQLRRPIVVAPMAGGPTTPELVAAGCRVGGAGFLPAGYLTAAVLEQKITALRDLLGPGEEAWGVNLFVPSPADRARDEAAVEAYRARLGDGAGEPRWEDDDHYPDKLRLLTEVSPVPMVSFTFGCPTREVVDALHAVGSSVLVTVTERHEATAAVACGADALVVQGFDAGGHRGTHDAAAEPNSRDALALLPELSYVELPKIAAGGVATAGDVRRLLEAGAVAVQVGTALLRCPEAGTSAAHRELLARATGTRITRAFSGRPARGLVNRFLTEHDAEAPSVYPQVDQVTKPLRAAAAAAGDGEAISGWAGTGWAAGQELPAEQVLTQLCEGL